MTYRSGGPSVAPVLPLTLVLLALGPAPAGSRRPQTVRALIQTDRGDIVVALDTARAPATATNFLRYVDAGLYDGGQFHRTVRAGNQSGHPTPIAVIQASIDPAREQNGFAPLALERTSATGLRHLDGTISMARDGPDTATSDFFICIGDQPSLDYGGKRNPDGQGFAAFGQVLRGMDVVQQIQAAPADGQTLTPAVKIVKAYVKR